MNEVNRIDRGIILFAIDAVRTSSHLRTMKFILPNEVRSKQYLEFIDGKSCILHNTAHGKRLDWIMAGNGDKAFSVAHNNMLSLSDNLKTNFFKGANCENVVDSRQLRHSQAATSIS